MKTMKHFTHLFLLLCLTGGLLANCSDEGFTHFDGKQAGIYIQGIAYTDINGVPQQYKDSAQLSFSSYSAKVTEARASVPVCIMGNVTDYDRPFSLVVDESSTAQRGVHFDFADSACVIPAGKAKVNVPVTLYRHPDLVSKALRVVLALRDNDQFTVVMHTYKNSPNWAATGKQLDGSRYKIIFSDMMAITRWWEWFGGYFFGDWSASKEKRVNAIMGWTHLDWERSNVPYGHMGYAARKLREELQRLADEGTPVIDDNGSYMQLNPDYAVDYSKYE